MFFSTNVLTKQGPLGIIWLASHDPKRLKKTDVLHASIQDACENIREPQVPLALRTTGHLILGVAKIYYKKADFLLMDVNEVKSKIKMHSMTSAADKSAFAALLSSAAAAATTSAPSSSSSAAAASSSSSSGAADAAAAGGPSSEAANPFAGAALHHASLQSITLPESGGGAPFALSFGDNIPDLVPGEGTVFFFDQSQEPHRRASQSLHDSQVEEVERGRLRGLDDDGEDDIVMPSPERFRRDSTMGMDMEDEAAMFDQGPDMGDFLDVEGDMMDKLDLSGAPAAAGSSAAHESGSMGSVGGRSQPDMGLDVVPDLSMVGMPEGLDESLVLPETPAAAAGDAPPARKRRKTVMDATTVLSSDLMKRNLKSTDDVVRVLEYVPLSRAEHARRTRNQMTFEERFSRPVHQRNLALEVEELLSSMLTRKRLRSELEDVMSEVDEIEAARHESTIMEASRSMGSIPADNLPDMDFDVGSADGHTAGGDMMDEGDFFDVGVDMAPLDNMEEGEPGEARDLSLAGLDSLAHSPADTSRSSSQRERRSVQTMLELEKAFSKREEAQDEEPLSFFELVESKPRHSVAVAFHELLVLSTQGRIALRQDEPFGDIGISKTEGNVSLLEVEA